MALPVLEIMRLAPIGLRQSTMQLHVSATAQPQDTSALRALRIQASTDELSSDGGLAADRTRKLGEFSRTNSPLSVEEIKKRRNSWLGQHQESTPNLDSARGR